MACDKPALPIDETDATEAVPGGQVDADEEGIVDLSSLLKTQSNGGHRDAKDFLHGATAYATMSDGRISRPCVHDIAPACIGSLDFLPSRYRTKTLVSLEQGC